jgi:hypothetical protein
MTLICLPALGLNRKLCMILYQDSANPDDSCLGRNLETSIRNQSSRWDDSEIKVTGTYSLYFVDKHHSQHNIDTGSVRATPMKIYNVYPLTRPSMLLRVSRYDRSSDFFYCCTCCTWIYVVQSFLSKRYEMAFIYFFVACHAGIAL